MDEFDDNAWSNAEEGPPRGKDTSNNTGDQSSAGPHQQQEHVQQSSAPHIPPDNVDDPKSAKIVKESEKRQKAFFPQVEIKSEGEEVPDIEVVTHPPSDITDKVTEVTETPTKNPHPIPTIPSTPPVPAIIITRTTDGKIHSVTRTDSLEIPAHLYSSLNTPKKGKEIGIEGTVNTEALPQQLSPVIKRKSKTSNMKDDSSQVPESKKSSQNSPLTVSSPDTITDPIPSAISPIPDINIPKKAGNVIKKPTPRKSTPKKGYKTKNSPPRMKQTPVKNPKQAQHFPLQAKDGHETMEYDTQTPTPAKRTPKKGNKEDISPSIQVTPKTRRSNKAGKGKVAKEEGGGKSAESIRRSARLLAKVESVTKKLTYEKGEEMEGKGSETGEGNSEYSSVNYQSPLITEETGKEKRKPNEIGLPLFTKDFKGNARVFWPELTSLLEMHNDTFDGIKEIFHRVSLTQDQLATMTFHLTKDMKDVKHKVNEHEQKIGDSTRHTQVIDLTGNEGEMVKQDSGAASVIKMIDSDGEEVGHAEISRFVFTKAKPNIDPKPPTHSINDGQDDKPNRDPKEPTPSTSDSHNDQPKSHPKEDTPTSTDLKHDHNTHEDDEQEQAKVKCPSESVNLPNTSGQDENHLTSEQHITAEVPSHYIPHIRLLRNWFNIFLETIRQEKAQTEIAIRTPPLFHVMQELADNLPSDEDIQCADDIPQVYKEIMKGEEYLTFHENVPKEKFTVPYQLLCKDFLKLHIQEESEESYNTSQINNQCVEKKGDASCIFGKTGFPNKDCNMQEEGLTTKLPQNSQLINESDSICVHKDTLSYATNITDKCANGNASLHIYVKPSTSQNDESVKGRDVGTSPYKVINTETALKSTEQVNMSPQSSLPTPSVQVAGDTEFIIKEKPTAKEGEQSTSSEEHNSKKKDIQNPTSISTRNSPQTHDINEKPRTSGDNGHVNVTDLLPIDMRKTTLDTSDHKREIVGRKPYTSPSYNEVIDLSTQHVSTPVPDNEVEIHTTQTNRENKEITHNEDCQGNQGVRCHVNVNLEREDDYNRMLRGFWLVGHVTDPSDGKYNEGQTVEKGNDAVTSISDKGDELPGVEGITRENREVAPTSPKEKDDLEIIQKEYESASGKGQLGESHDTENEDTNERQDENIKGNLGKSPTKENVIQNMEKLDSESQHITETSLTTARKEQMRETPEKNEGESEQIPGKNGTIQNTGNLTEINEGNNGGREKPSDNTVNAEKAEKYSTTQETDKSSVGDIACTSKKKTLKEIFPATPTDVGGGNSSPTWSMTSTESHVDNDNVRGNEQKQSQSCSKRTRRKKDTTPMRMVTRRQAADKNSQK